MILSASGPSAAQDAAGATGVGALDLFGMQIGAGNSGDFLVTAPLSAPNPKKECKIKIMRLAAIVLLFVLTGCTPFGTDLFRQNEPKPVPLEDEVVPQNSPQAGPASSVPLSSPAARAAAPTDATATSGDGLLDCVTESCKINCSPKIKKQFQPKWCARFKEPVE